MLAILDLFDRGFLTRNEIPLSPDLVTTFQRYFEVVRQRDDQPTIENPFYHLCGDGFWELAPKPGERPLYELGNASRIPTIKTLRETYGRFDDNLWTALLSDAHSRHQLREALIARYFPEYRDQFAAIVSLNPQPSALNLAEEPPGRDGAFRHTILEIYDYRCAACSIRVKINDDTCLVETAHIIPFSESQNDKPDNGLSLCPNHHWAMDRCLMAPCPDPAQRAGVWRVRPDLDCRIEGQKDLVALLGQPVIPPNEEKFFSAIESLRWRKQHLSVKY